MKYKKLLNRVFTGLAIYEFGNLWFHIGKGHMLALLSRYGITADDAITILSEDDKKPYPTKVILGSYKLMKESCSRKEES